MHYFTTAQVIASQQDFVLFVIVIAISFLIMSAFLVGIIINVYRQRIINQKKILIAVYNAQESEKTRIAEDLHDNLGASLSALKLRIDTIKEESHDPLSVNMAVESNQLLDDIISDLRGIVRNQTSNYLLTNGFKSELQRFKTQFTTNNKISFEMIISDQLPPLNNDFGVNLFRIVQELVNNSIKHSDCNKISLKIVPSGNYVEFNYEDNGKGFQLDEAMNTGMGLSNIRARVKLYNGKYHIDTLPGKSVRYNLVFNIADINK